MRSSWKENVKTLLKITVAYSIIWLIMPLMTIRPILSFFINLAFYSLFFFLFIHLIRLSANVLNKIIGIIFSKDAKIEVTILPYFDSSRHSFIHSIWPLFIFERKLLRSLEKNA